MKRLEGSAAVITGASSGIGRATALAFAREGARVVLVARREDALANLADEVAAAGSEALVCAADVTAEGVAARVVGDCLARFGRLDVLVNNAGSNLWERSIAKTPVDDFRRLIELNLTSAYAFSHAALAVMVGQKSGTMVHIGWTGVWKHHLIVGVAYMSAKAGLDGLSRFINVEGNEHGVRSTYLAPGSTVTDLLDYRDNPSTPEQREMMIYPEDVADAAVFVATLPRRAAVDIIHVRPTLTGA